MQAIELQAQITASHEIHLQLPTTINAGIVKVIVMYDISDNAIAETPKKRSFGQFRQQVQIDSNFDDELSPDFWLGSSV